MLQEKTLYMVFETTLCEYHNIFYKIINTLIDIFQNIRYSIGEKDVQYAPGAAAEKEPKGRRRRRGPEFGGMRI